MTVPPPQHQPPLHHHRHSTCHRHPTKPITGFCATCLRERLAGIDPDTHQETPITYLAAELRRSKSYSCCSNPNNASSSSTSTTTNGSEQPRRKSCDVRSGNTLSDLFNIDDKKRFSLNRKLKVENLGLDLKEEDENEVETRVFEEVSVGNVVADFDEDGEFKTMKEFIDLEWEKRKNSGKDFSFWGAASVFRKKLVKWQLKQKKKESKKGKKHGGGDGDLVVETEKPSVRRLRDTQSEIGEYGFGRRSCDTDPRLSVDVARLSVDDARYSFDEPRASWDGYLIGKTCPRLAPLVSVIEDVKLSGNEVENLKEGLDLKIEGENSPGGTAQTRDFYSDRRRRRSFDRGGSNRRLTLGEDEFKSISNAKVSPEIGLFHGAKLLVTEKELRDSNWYSLKDYHGETTDALAKDVDSLAAGISKTVFKLKKMQRWRGVWNIWSLMQRSDSKCGDEESSIGGNVVDAAQVRESLQKLDGVKNVESSETVSQKLIRSYTVSAKDSSKMAFDGSGIIDPKEYAMKRREDPVLQRNRSARYSPNHLDNGMLRFYLTPLRSYGRSKSGKSRLQNSQSMARNVL